MLDIKAIFLTLGIAVIIIGGMAIGLVQMGAAVAPANCGATNCSTIAGHQIASAMNSGATGFTGFITTWVPLIIVFIGIGLAVYYLLAFLGGSNAR